MKTEENLKVIELRNYLVQPVENLLLEITVWKIL